MQADVAQAIEKLKRKLVECNRYNYCADAVKGVEDACRAVSYSHADNQPASGNQAAESNRGNEWTGNPDIDNAIIMLDRIDTLESCDDDRIEAVKAVLRRLAGNSPVTPDMTTGWQELTEQEYEFVKDNASENAEFRTVYTAPPATVVPDERAAFNAWNNDENLPIAGVGAKNAAWLAWQARAELGRSLAVNSPVTPDGWISCSERMPPQDDWILIYSKHGEYMAGQVQGEYVELSDGTLSWLGNAL
ncbi:TPA: DUF551 domain-containing protein, partial [Escherichia coli]